MGLKLNYIRGQTPLNEDEIDGLLIPTITTREELNEFEQQNIEQAIQWSLRRKFSTARILTEGFVKEVHKKMYGEVWAWAGTFRTTNKNIGIHFLQIGIQLKCLLDDTLYWINHHTFSPDEIAVRFKHRLVSIHCFPNGNGRHSRLMADILIEKTFGLPVFTWGAGNLTQEGDARTTYISGCEGCRSGQYCTPPGFCTSLNRKSSDRCLNRHQVFSMIISPLVGSCQKLPPPLTEIIFWVTVFSYL